MHWGVLKDGMPGEELRWQLGVGGRQVHRAVLKDGMIVAVKMFYPSLRKEIASDFEVFKSVSSSQT